MNIRANKKIKNVGYCSKLILRACLIAVFFILLSVFGVMAVCWGDAFYNSSRGISKSPLLNAYVIVTESMVPTINVNDAIIVKRVKNNTLDIGDIITFSSNDIYFNGLTVTHRIVGKKLDVDGNYIYRTKGDNNSLEDTALVDLDNIYGKVVLRLPKIGYVQGFVSTPLGFVLSIIIPVLMAVYYEAWRIYKTIKQRYAEVEI